MAVSRREDVSMANHFIWFDEYVENLQLAGIEIDSVT